MDVVIPVLETRTVLLSHLLAKVRSLCGFSCAYKAEDITSKIAETLSDNEIINLLTSEIDLKLVYANIVGNRESEQKSDIGEKLYILVSRLDPVLCAQITGMLLELDVTTLQCLINSENQLEIAVDKAKQEYLKFLHEDELNKNIVYQHEELGEVLFELITIYYPDPYLASRLTGMLLELDNFQLKLLVRNPEELKVKLELACEALSTTF